ncbi:hypothetical protein CFOL_v3_29114 [Cephalotus follicularis]|uniref:Zf-RVT domain-containing protein n=1 Tax=Cephalotus follicularis TaxID=3775 RepID=A0A1Q3CZL9_CEPFO|nr:hypothetical protein CFOL_v3_29114 [Cephalotus follicularis]
MSNSLFFGGRLQLLSSVLFSIQVFWCSTFILLVAVTKECDRIMRSFLWHGLGNVKRSGKVAWSKPKKEGGLVIKNCRAWNQAAIMKIGWDICQKKESIWIDWCYVVFLKETNFWAAKVTNNFFWSWRNVLNSRKLLAHKLLYEVGDGHSFSLWFDPWLCGDSIDDRYGGRVIHDSGLLRNARVSSVIKEGVWDWPLTSLDLIDISNITTGIPLSNTVDVLVSIVVLMITYLSLTSLFYVQDT